MELFSDDVAVFIDSRDWPRGLHYRFMEVYDPAPHIDIVFFRDNWLTLTPDEQLKTTEIVREIMAKLWADGIPTYVEKMENAQA